MANRTPSNSVRYWTDEETGILQSWAGSDRDLAELLDRTVKAVRGRRDALKAGGGLAELASWTDEEDQLLLDNRHLSTQEMARILPGRGPGSVGHRREYLTRVAGVRFHKHGKQNLNPFSMRDRTLIAKTCLQCGELMDASWYYRNRQMGSWSTVCQACKRGLYRYPEETMAEYKRRFIERHDMQQINRTGKQRRKERELAMQERTTPAVRGGLPWMDEDHDVLRDSDLTILEKAVKLQRSYKATLEALRVNHYRSRRQMRSKTEGVWLIERAA